MTDKTDTTALNDHTPGEWDCIGWFLQDPTDPTAQPFCRVVRVTANDRTDAFNLSEDIFRAGSTFELLNWYAKAVTNVTLPVNR